MIVVASELYWPELTSTGRYLTAIAEGLAREDDVLVLAAQPTYSSRGQLAPRTETRNGTHIVRVRSTRLDKNRILPRLVNALSVSASMLYEGLRRVPRGATIMVVTNPPFLPYVMALVARLKGANLVLLIHDVYPEVLVASGFAPERSLLVRVTGAASRWLYRRADRLIVLGRDMRDLVAGRQLEGAPEPIVIPHWMDAEVSEQPRPGNGLLTKLGLDGGFVAQYAGNMGRSHDLGLIVDAAEALAREDAGWAFLLVGWGARRAAIETDIERRGLRNARVLDPLPADELNTVLAACDVGIISFMPGMSGVSVPSRMYNVMAAGRPMIAVTEETSELARVIREERIGWVVAPRDRAGLIAALRDARSDPARLAEMGQRARAAALARYTLDVALPRYADALRFPA